MEEMVVKEGLLYLQQQQTFGKKWRKFWGILHQQSTWAPAQLELLEGSQPPMAGKAKKGEGSRRLIKLTDCVHVAEVPRDQASSPRETTPFLLETTEKRYLLAAERMEATTWIMGLCEHAFSTSAEAMKMANTLKSGIPSPSFTMAENSLYNTVCQAEQPFPVTLVATPTSENCQLGGRFLLYVKVDALELCNILEGEVLYSWPYQFLRRFGHDKAIFLFEAGRRCISGEGVFEFATRQGRDILQGIDAAIRAQNAAGMQDIYPEGAFLAGTTKAEGGAQVDKVTAQGEGQPLHATSSRSLSLETDWQGKPGKAIVVKPLASCPLSRAKDLSVSWPRQDFQCGPRGLEAAVERTLPGVKVAPKPQEPFAAISKPGSKIDANLLLQNPEGPTASSPSRGKIASLGQECLYDDPDSVAFLVYDEPQEVKGEAWKLQAPAENSAGHGYPPVAHARVNDRRPGASPNCMGKIKNRLWEATCDKNIALRIGSVASERREGAGSGSGAG